MSQPTPYTRKFSFTNDQTANPSTKTPGNQLDIEYNAILLTLNQALANLALIQRDDGKLANGSVGSDQLAPGFAAGVSPATLWASPVNYSSGATVFFGSKLYRCLVSHISGTFATDLAAGDWLLIGDFSFSVAGTASEITVTTSPAGLNVVSLPAALTFTGKTVTGGTFSGGAFSGTYNGNTFTTGTGTLTIGAGKTVTFSNTLTFAGTDGTTQTFPATSGTVVTSVTAAGGDLTGSYPGPTIAANVVTNAKLAQMPTLTLKGNNTGGTAAASDLTVAQTIAMLGGVFGARLAKTAAYTVTTSDDGVTIALGGAAFYALTFPTASTLAAAHKNVVINEDTGRAKNIVITGGTSFFLYPGQTAVVYNDNNVWQVSRNNRWRLTGNVTLNVDPVNGNNANDGFATGAGNAMASFQAAYDRAADGWDLAGFTVTMLSAAGQTYTNGGIKTYKGILGQSTAASVMVDGNSSTFNCTDGSFSFAVGSAVTAEGAFPARFGVRRATLTGSASSGGVNSNGGVIWLADGMNFGACPGGNHMAAIGGGAQIILINQSYTISGGAANHALAWSNGFTVIQSDTVTLTGTPAFTTAFAQAQWYGQVYAAFTTFTGAATGPRYVEANGGYLDTQNPSLTYFPGNAAGTSNNALYAGRFQNLQVSGNTSAAPTAIPGSSLATFQGADGTLTIIEMMAHGAQGMLAFRRANGTAAAMTALAANDTIGGVQWMGYGTSLMNSAAAALQVNAGEAWTGTAQGTYMTFFTSANGGTAIGEKMRLHGSGGLSLGSTADPGAGIFAATALKGIASATAAPAGCVGEVIQASVAPGSAIAVASVTPVNLASISLPAGDWEVTCEVHYVFGAGASYTQLITSISGVSVTTSQIPFSFAQLSSASNAVPTSAIVTVKAGPQQILVGVTTTYFCVLNQVIAGTVTAWGGIRARRMR